MLIYFNLRAIARAGRRGELQGAGEWIRIAASEETALRKIVECIPNFSEGRNAQVIDEIVAAIQSVAGAVLLDREADADHHRSVITFVAPPGAVVDAAIAGARKAAELINLNRSEERRVGKECRSRRSRYSENKKLRDRN